VQGIARAQPPGDAMGQSEPSVLPLVIDLVDVFHGSVEGGLPGLIDPEAVPFWYEQADRRPVG
jgi:hypothetical protein